MTVDQCILLPSEFTAAGKSLASMFAVMKGDKQWVNSWILYNQPEATHRECGLDNNNDSLSSFPFHHSSSWEMYDQQIYPKFLFLRESQRSHKLRSRLGGNLQLKLGSALTF